MRGLFFDNACQSDEVHERLGYAASVIHACRDIGARFPRDGDRHEFDIWHDIDVRGAKHLQRCFLKSLRSLRCFIEFMRGFG